MKVKFRISNLRVLFLVLIFLQPACISSLENCLIFSRMLAVLRYLVSLYAICRLIITKNERIRIQNVYFILYFVAIVLQMVSMYFNETVYFTALMSCVSFIGVVIITMLECENNQNCFFQIIKHYLWVCVVIHLITLLFCPNGLTKGVVGDGRIYFLGTKNTITMYIILLMLVSYCGTSDIKKRKLWFEWCAIFAVVLINKSSTAILVTFAIIFFGLISRIFSSMRQLNTLFQKGTIVSGFLIGIWFMISVVLKNSGDGDTMSLLTLFLGKEVTFSGRRAIWLRAIEYIADNPLWGSGNDISYNVWENGIIVHSAHNSFLDYAVKYGCISLSVMIMSVFYVIYRLFVKLFNNRKSENIRFLAIVGITVLFASLFEAIENYYSTWIIITSIFIIVTEKKNDNEEFGQHKMEVIN